MFNLIMAALKSRQHFLVRSRKKTKAEHEVRDMWQKGKAERFQR